MNKDIAKEQIFPDVPEKFNEGYPEDYRPWVNAWAFTVDEMKERLSDGTLKLLTLDISICEDDYVDQVNAGVLDLPIAERREVLTTRAEELYGCDIGCEHCFECRTETENLLIKTEEVYRLLLEAKKLGLKTVKFLGPGELLHNPRLFEILDFLRDNNIEIGIFTKGIILGDDQYSMRIFGMSSVDLCRLLYSYDNVTVLLGFTSADKRSEEDRIDSRKVPDFFDKRNRAFKNLASVGFNEDVRKQRLALICAPVLRDNIDEVLDIYKWGTLRNIPVVVAPTMISGKGSDMVEITDSDFKNKQLVDLYVEIYLWLIREKILTVSQIQNEGISPYPGFACNQVVSGMLIRKDGRVQACPGNEDDCFIYARDIRQVDLKELWVNSLGYKLREKLIESGDLTLTQPCYAKSEGIFVRSGRGSIPSGFYDKVLHEINLNLL